MPYGRKYKKAGGGRGRKPKKNRTDRKIESIARKVVNRNSEVKRYMSSAIEQKVDTLTPGTNWLQPFVSVAQGTNSYNRVGSKIRVIGLQLKNFFHNNTTVPLWLRMVVLRLPAGTVPGSSNTLFMNTNNTEANFTAVNGINAMMKPIHPAWGKVLYNKVFKLTPSAGEGQTSYTRLDKFFKFRRGINVNFNESGTTAGNVDKQIVVGVWAAEAPEDTTTGSTVEWSWEFNLFFTDA